MDRAQLLMACGTGKTITTHALAVQLPAGQLLVLGADEQAAAAVDQRVLVDTGVSTDARTLAAA